jgi:hypothetical protein
MDGQKVYIDGHRETHLNPAEASSEKHDLEIGNLSTYLKLYSIGSPPFHEGDVAFKPQQKSPKAASNAIGSMLAIGRIRH